jgi:hypothetical protein
MPMKYVRVVRVRVPAAMEAYRASLAIRQKLADADPRNAQAQRDHRPSSASSRKIAGGDDPP